MKIEKIVKKLLKRTRNASNIQEISYEKLYSLLKSNANIVLVDVRSPQEFAENRINTAINIPLYDIEKKASSILKNKEEIIVIYCQSGMRSKKACMLLEKLGYTNLYNLSGGLNSRNSLK